MCKLITSVSLFVHGFVISDFDDIEFEGLSLTAMVGNWESELGHGWLVAGARYVSTLTDYLLPYQWARQPRSMATYGYTFKPIHATRVDEVKYQLQFNEESQSSHVSFSDSVHV